VTRAVVDSDFLVYSCGFAVEKTWYDVAVERGDGSAEEGMFRTRDEAEAWLSYEDEATTRQVDRRIEAEPLANALYLASRTLSGIDSALTERGIEFDSLELFLTGKGNFRDALATIKGYKANRDPLHRPVHYKPIRRYLINRWGAAVVDGIEADDAVAMAAAEKDYDPERIVIVTCDKDLFTVPGLQYNFRKKQFVTVTPEEALVNFYRQLIVGDTTDNIGGAHRAGEKAALACIVPGMTEREMYLAALALYERGKEAKGCLYANLSGEAALLENARLIHLKRAIHDVWQPPQDTGAGSRPGSPKGSKRKK